MARGRRHPARRDDPTIRDPYDAVVRITTSAIREPVVDAIEANETFDRREPGWTKVARETT